MRAKFINRRAYCFDFDETLVKTDARINVYRKGVIVKSLDSKQFNFYKAHPDDKFDFDEFRDGELILKAKKYKMWPVIKAISDAVKEDRSTSDIYILTARGLSCRPYIYEFLKRNGIEIVLKNILTLGDDIGKINISEEKRKVLVRMAKKYDTVTFFDDDPKNIALGKSVPGIKTRLVEMQNN